MVFRHSYIGRCKFPVLCGNVPEILLCIVDELEVGGGFFPISSRSWGSFLSWWNFLASSMYLLLICLSDTISSMLKPKIPSESLRFTPTPSGSNPLLSRGYLRLQPG